MYVFPRMMSYQDKISVVLPSGSTVEEHHSDLPFSWKHLKYEKKYIPERNIVLNKMNRSLYSNFLRLYYYLGQFCNMYIDI